MSVARWILCCSEIDARDFSCWALAAVSANQGNFLGNTKTSPWIIPEIDPRTSVMIEIMDVFIAGDAYIIVKNILSEIINEKILVGP